MIATHGAQRYDWTILFGVMAVVFNPVISIPLRREAWSILSVASGILLLISISIDPVF
jgi:hypothetical protein